MGTTRDLTTLVADTAYTDLPQQTVDATKLAVMNIVGCMLAGYQTRIGKLHTEMAKDMGGGREQSTIIGDGTKVSAPLAAYANGNFGFALDYEDTVLYVSHPGYITTSSGLAIGEMLGSSGKELILGIALGFEIVARMGAAMQPTPERGAQVWGEQYHPFASAVTAGKLYGLDAETLDVAFGIAGTYATVPSAYKYFGVVAETRPMREVKLGWGWMSMAGTVAAQSAHRGFRGGHGVMDGDQGFYVMAGSDRCDHDLMVKDLGKSWLIDKTEYKIHPSIAWNHPAFDATRGLVNEHNITPDQVEKIHISGMGLNLVGDTNPQGAVDGQFSLPYTVVTTIMREPLLPAMYSDEKLADPVLRDLLSKVEIHHDKAADADFFTDQKMRFGVELTLKGGNVVKRDVEWPRDQPPMGRPEIEKKFRELAGTVLNDKRTEEVLQAIDSLDSFDNVTDFVRLLV
jgi:2-methylcitrate dehydratase PrpD